SRQVGVPAGVLLEGEIQEDPDLRDDASGLDARGDGAELLPERTDAIRPERGSVVVGSIGRAHESYPVPTPRYLRNAPVSSRFKALSSFGTRSFQSVPRVGNTTTSYSVLTTMIRPSDTAIFGLGWRISLRPARTRSTTRSSARISSFAALRMNSVSERPIVK